jgi:hypothetical protein
MDRHIGSSLQDSVLDFYGKDTLTGNSGERNFVLTVTGGDDFDNFARRTY